MKWPSLGEFGWPPGIDLGLIVETRKGARPNKASLYAVTWCELDHCDGKLDISAQSFARGAYRLRDPLPPIQPKTHRLLHAVK